MTEFKGTEQKKSGAEGSEKILTAEVMIGHLLRWGVVLGAGLIFLGGLLAYVEGDSSFHHLELLRQGQESNPNPWLSQHWGDLPGLMRQGSSTAWMVCGLLVLVMLPLLRVLLAAGVFFLQKDYLFVLFCLVVMMNLAIGLIYRIGL